MSGRDVLLQVRVDRSHNSMRGLDILLQVRIERRLTTGRGEAARKVSAARRPWRPEQRIERVSRRPNVARTRRATPTRPHRRQGRICGCTNHTCTRFTYGLVQ